MLGEWTEDKDGAVAPYILYIRALGNAILPSGPHQAPDGEPTLVNPPIDSHAQVDGFRGLLESVDFDDDGTPVLPGATTSAGEPDGGGSGTGVSSSGGFDAALPEALDRLPEAVRNDTYSPHAPIDFGQLLKAQPLKIADDAVFTVVIDAGIVPAHDRFRAADGSTRVVASWQQYVVSSQTDPSLPFGHELMRSEIDADIARIDSGAMSEEQVLRHRGLIGDGTQPAGTQMLRHASHGMHTADLAVGRGVGDRPAVGAEPIFLVNLPPRRAVGRSGVYLPAFVLPAISRAMAWIDLLWDLVGSGRPGDAWPVVINLSYGQTAGPKDGHELIETLLAQMMERRRAEGRPIPTIVMPAGNSNLEFGHVTDEIGPDGEVAFKFHVQPEDFTASVVEFWTDVLPEAAWPVDVGLSVRGAPMHFVAPKPGADHLVADIVVDGSRVGMAFARRHARARGYRFQYVFILNPTQTAETVPEGTRLAPHGLWEVVFKARHPGPMTITGDIEVDQALRSDDLTVRRAYFVDPVFSDGTDARGRVFDVGELRQPNVDDLRAQVKQIGSQNSHANLSYITTVAGHRRSDGAPAPYSAAMKGTTETGATRRLDASLPCEDAPAHFGTLAAGIGSCATSVRSGTSFAAALATRSLVQQLRRNGQATVHPIVEPEIRAKWQDRPTVRQDVPEAKIGPDGRSDRADRVPVERLKSGF